jgi:tetratricopeptide (TPR) repeat protein
LEIDRRNLGPDHPAVARDLNNLAGLLRATNRLIEAEPLYRWALAIDKNNFGPDHPNVASVLNNLARLLRDLALFLRDTERMTEAERRYRRALEIVEASFGPNHPTVAIYLNNLADVLIATNRLGEAEPLMRRHLVIFIDFECKTMHPHAHRDAAIKNYASLLAAMGKSAAEIKAAIASLIGEDRPRDPH